jgi:hypothetical protein
MRYPFSRHLILLIFIVKVSVVNSQLKPKDTEVWNPIPPVISSGNQVTAPSDAIVLFNGEDFSNWVSSIDREDVQWILNNDRSMTVDPGKGSIETIMEHGSIQLHLEWKTPDEVKSSDQGRGNSGVIFQNRFEVQILDSYDNRTYSNGQAASIYKQHIPLVNTSRPPGEWQEYDIIFMEPIYNESGETKQNGRFTVFHNGVLVQNNVELLGTTEYIGNPKTRIDDIRGFIQGKGLKRNLLLQDHGNLVSFRNIWMRPLDNN